jgi:hypothetical protein
MQRGLDVDHPVYPDREAVFRRYAWMQWTEDEIRTGEPFARLLTAPHDGKPEILIDPDAVSSAWTAAGRVRAFAAGSKRNPLAKVARRFIG